MIASRTSRPARIVFAALVAGVCVAAALTGCSAGQITQTSSQVAAVPGANADAGNTALRNLVIVYNGPQGYPAGGSAPLAVRIFNNGTKPVTLTGVSADAAKSVSLVSSGAVPAPVPTTSTPTPTPTSAAPTGSATPTGSGTATATPTHTATPTPVPAAIPLAVTIAPQAYKLLVPGQPDGYLRLDGLTGPIVPGSFVTLTFTFDDGSKAVVQVPLAPPSSEVPRATSVVGGE